MSQLHLTHEDRIRLAALNRAGFNQTEIANELGKHKSTISRELSQKGTPNKSGYNVKIAQEITEQRRLLANQHFRKIEGNTKTKNYIKRGLKKTWSPEQIAGRLKLENNNQTIICKESIYQYIYDEGGKLTKHLRYKKNKYRRRHGTKKRENERKLACTKRRIDQRPEEANQRLEIGHWENDTVVGSANSGAIATHAERKSGYYLGDKIERNNADNFRKATIKRFKRMPKKKRLTFTMDNGSETSDYELIEKDLGTTIYFANPYCAWERPTNENTNGLLREFFPKGTSFATVTQKDVDRAVRLLNHRPRKRLGYLTPHEVFVKSCVSE
jgi:IS30 family transposase